MTVSNASNDKLLKVIFQDKDEINLRPGETLVFSDKYKVLKTLYWR